MKHRDLQRRSCNKLTIATIKWTWIGQKHGRSMNREPKRATDVPSPIASGDWAKRLRQGEPDAVHMVRERVRKILGFQRLRIPASEREDLEQEVMTELWQAVNRSSFDFTAGFWGFVEIVTSRRCIDWLRKRKDQVPVVEGLRDERENPFDKVQRSERAAIAARIIQAMDSNCREILVMRFQKGMGYGEISERLGKSEGAMRVQMHRCVKRAREMFQSVDSPRIEDYRRDDSDESS